MATLYELAEGLLEAVLQQARTNDVDLPSRQLIYPAPIPTDCEQVAVLFNGWSLAQDTGQLVNCLTSPLLAGLSVVITRKTPALPKAGTKSALPTIDAMGAAALMASTDAELLRDVLLGLSPISSPLIVVQAPVGGYQTVEMNVSLLGT